MIKEITMRVSPGVLHHPEQLEKEIEKVSGVSAKELTGYRVVRRSVDARKRNVVYNIMVRVATEGENLGGEAVPVEYAPLMEDAPRGVIVGAGPAGLFAALKCLELGIRPILLERGKDVDSRRLDLANISRERRINPDSNYCFGEGGAGAYSDGKLYTRSKKRGNVREVLQLLVNHGASTDILVDAHPHIGSDRLPGVIKAIRETIIRNGGEVRFGARVDHLIVEDGNAAGVELAGGEKVRGQFVILAIGHSARDTIESLHADGLNMEAKGIAVGVRLEHPQKLIDAIQYHNPAGRGKFLPAAEYSFVTQVESRGVYSFCMCPGGVIVPAGSAENELVVNGMSASARAGQKANSGMVVEIRPGDFPEYEKFGEFELLMLQRDLERRFFEASGNSIVAPAQRMEDFVNGKKSTSLAVTTYAPGVVAADFNILFPPFISWRLREGLKEFGRKSKGFLTNEAMLVGLESRTSSPVRIPRDNETYEHIRIKSLYPVGEGAGYAGGIVSAAIDGINAASAAAARLQNLTNS